MKNAHTKRSTPLYQQLKASAAKTILTKISDEKILIKRYYSSGRLKFETSLHEMPDELRGRENGAEVTMKEYVTKHYNRDGKASWWLDNGHKVREENWKNGRRVGDGRMDGRQTWWYNNGQMRKEAHYKDGKLNGAWTLWFDNGQMKTEGHRKDDRLDGKVTTWFKDGRIKSEKHYKDGERYE